MSKILYYISGLIIFIPILLILDFPIWLTVLLCAIGFVLNTFAIIFPFPALIYEAVFWIWGLIVLFNQPFSYITVIAIIGLIYWVCSNIYLLNIWANMLKQK